MYQNFSLPIEQCIYIAIADCVIVTAKPCSQLCWPTLHYVMLMCVGMFVCLRTKPFMTCFSNPWMKQMNF